MDQQEKLSNLFARLEDVQLQLIKLNQNIRILEEEANELVREIKKLQGKVSS